MSAIGTAKIVSNIGSGKYTISQVFWDTASSTYKTGTLGLLRYYAVDVGLRANRSVDDIVLFTLQETYSGPTRAMIIGDFDGSPSGSPNAPIEYNGWIDIDGDNTAYELDPRKWSGRMLAISTVVASGSGISDPTDPTWVATNIGHYSYYNATWTAATANAWWFQPTNLGGDVQDLTRLYVGAGAPDATIRMTASGTLELETTGYVATEYHIRTIIRGSERLTSSDMINPPPVA